MQLDITLNDDQVNAIVVKYLVIKIDALEIEIIAREKAIKADNLLEDESEYHFGKIYECGEDIRIFENTLIALGYTYEDAAEKFNIPTLRRQETFTAV